MASVQDVALSPVLLLNALKRCLPLIVGFQIRSTARPCPDALLLSAARARQLEGVHDGPVLESADELLKKARPLNRSLSLLPLCALVMVLPLPAHAQAGLQQRSVDVVHYVARIEPDVAAKTVAGRVVIQFVAAGPSQQTIELDRGELTVDGVTERGAPLEFELGERRLIVHLARVPSPRRVREIEVEYHGAPRSGLRFFPERLQVYTVFSTSQWLICTDAPADRATLDLTVVLPGGVSAVGTGRVVSRRPVAGGKVEHRWRQDHPVPTYTFGFAAGRFTDVVERHGRTALRFLGEGFSEAELRQLFRDTPDMIDFFEDRAGTPYVDATYTQALVVDTAGQEMSGLVVMSENYGRAVLKDPRAVLLSAHELAHQWWGNMVTCRDWTHFWLNEGFATFMAAAYLEHRFGREAYLREIEASRQRYERVRDDDGDRSLVFVNWSRPTTADRTLVYRKGAYVLHLLRELLGDGAFWDGIRRYTRAQFGRSVVTEDFQRAMEESSGRSLASFFAQWVYLTKAP